MDSGRPFQEYKPGASRYNGRISEEEWNKHKPKLRQLHEAKHTRAQILEIISPEFEDVKPTYGQLCTKFDKWGFRVYRQNERKDTALGGKKAQQKKASQSDPASTEADIQQAFTPESSNGSTIVPDVGALKLDDRFSDKATPRTLADFGTPQTQYLEPSVAGWSDSTPRATTHSRNVSDQSSSPQPGTINDSQTYYQNPDPDNYSYPNSQHGQQWVNSVNSFSTTAPSHSYRNSYSDTQSSRTSLYQTTSEINAVEPDDPETIAARSHKADEALDAVNSYVRSIGQKQQKGEDITSMVSLAAYLFATRSYSSAFRIYHKIYDIMSQDMECDDVSKLGALMRCYQSAVEPYDLDFMQRELHSILHWNFSDSSLEAFTIQMLQSVETQISEGFNLAQGSVLSTSSITRNLSHLAVKGTTSDYPGTKRLYWRLRLLKHSPFHSGCTRLLRLMSELLSYAWAAMAVVRFPDSAVNTTGCLCKDGMYFDFVRMVTTAILEAAMGFEISQLIKMPSLKSTPCACVMCADLESTFDLCPIETFTAIALLTVDRCRLDWTSCHPGGRHQELTPHIILTQQLRPTFDSLLDQVAADIRSPTTIHTSDLYDDFLNCLWSCFETHDLPLKNARFDASDEKVEDLMTMLITEELNKSHPAQRNSTLEDAKTPTFTYESNNHNADEIAKQITAKRTRSNASALTKSSSNASERSMIRIRKKLKYRTSGDYLNSMASYSSLSSRNSMNRFSYVTGLPELETVMDDEELRSQLPPDLTPDEYRSMQRHDSWSRRSDHFSWIPSRPGSLAARNSWRESNNNYAQGSNSRQGSISSQAGQVNQLGKRTSQKELGTRELAMQNSLRESLQQQQMQQQGQHQQPQQNQAQYRQQQPPEPEPQYQQTQQPPSRNVYQISNQNRAAYQQNQHQYQHTQAQSQYIKYQNQTQRPQPQQAYPPQIMPPPTQIPHIQQDANSSQGSLASQSTTTAATERASDMLHANGKPQRRDSNRTTSSKESQKGKYKDERRRIDNILKAIQ